jgi:predicted permease
VTVGTLASSYVNAGNVGLPLAVYLLGDAVAVVPTLLFQLLVLAPVAFVVLDAGAAQGGGSTEPVPVGVRARAALRRTLGNPIIVATLVGLVLAALPWDLPDVVYEPFRLVGAAAAPLALLTFGMSLALPRTRDTAAPRPDLALAVSLRTVVQPLLAWTIGTALSLPAHTLLGVVAMAALPTAQNVLVYAMQYRHGEALARDAGLFTTVLCVPVLLVVAATLG